MTDQELPTWKQIREMADEVHLRAGTAPNDLSIRRICDMVMTMATLMESHEQILEEITRMSKNTKIRVTVEDLSGEQDTETTEIEDNYIIVCAGSYYVAHEQRYPKTGTVQITIKRDAP